MKISGTKINAAFMGMKNRQVEQKPKAVMFGIE